jgi:hypothetical protein
MTRFASLGSSGAASYAAAGKAAAGSAARMFDVQRKTGPDYAGLSKVAMAAQTAENIAATQAEETVGKAAITATATAQIGKIRGQYAVEKGKFDTKQRMAGILPAVGKIVGSAFKKDPKRPPPSLLVEPVKPEKVEYPTGNGERPTAPGQPELLPIPSPSSPTPSTSEVPTSEPTYSDSDLSTSGPLNLSKKDYDELAFAVTSEAARGTKDEYGVAASIINRLRSGKHGGSIYDIVRAKGQYQGVEIGNSYYDPKLSARFQSPEGQNELQSALKVLNGRTDFKGQTQLKNRVPAEDPMFSNEGNFFHYSWQ